ncbi:MAG: glycosyltransferase family 4 protein [Candidatus Spyradenecus sp.]
MNKTICFLMPGKDNGPVGGFKVVYEYANRLARDGWSVSIIYPLIGDPKQFWIDFRAKPYRTIRRLLSSMKAVFRHKKALRTWATLDDRIRRGYPISLALWLRCRRLKNTHFIATYVTTAMTLAKSRKKKVYWFIQAKEDWDWISEDRLYAEYRNRLVKFAVSEWLVNEVQKAGGKAECLPNGFDFSRFQLTNPIEGRKATEVVILYHTQPVKRIEDLIEALTLVKQRVPALHVVAFGTSSLPLDLPEWVTYVQKPNQVLHNQIYNTGAIYAAASDEHEGFGLTVGEAMICGMAVACTNNGGFTTMAKNEKTALLSPIRSPQALADNIIRLIENRDLRERVARNGNQFIQHFTWDKSYKTLLEILDTEH